MANFDELFKEITSKYPYALAALALKTPDVEVGDRLNTEHITVRVHHSDMTFHIEVIRTLAFREFSPPARIVSKPYYGGTHARISFLRTRPATRCRTRCAGDEY